MPRDAVAAGDPSIARRGVGSDEPLDRCDQMILGVRGDRVAPGPVTTPFPVRCHPAKPRPLAGQGLR